MPLQREVVKDDRRVACRLAAACRRLNAGLRQAAAGLPDAVCRRPGAGRRRAEACVAETGDARVFDLASHLELLQIHPLQAAAQTSP